MLGCVAACRPPHDPGDPPLEGEPPPRPVAEVHVTVDGRDVDCSRTSYLGVGERPVVRLRAHGGDVRSFEVRLDGSPLIAEAAGDELLASVALVSEPRRLAIEREGRESCRVYLRDDGADRAAMDRLVGSSEGPTRVSRSSRTGNASNVTGTFALPSAATRREAVEAFVREHAGAFGVVPTQLVWEELRDSSDGWQTHRFRQELMGRRVLGAVLDAVVDEAGHVRGLHSTLLPALVIAPAVRRSSEEVRASVDATDVPRAVLYTELTALGEGSPELRSAWEAAKESEALLIDDVTGEVRHRVDRTISLKLDALDPSDGSVVISGDPRMPPNICVGTLGPSCDFDASADERTVWSNFAGILRWARSRRIPGWLARGYSCPEGCFGATPPAGCPCLAHEGPAHFKFAVLPTRQVGFFDGGSMNYVGIDPSAVDEIDVLCHEHAHGIDFGQHGVRVNPRTTQEAAADLFAIACERELAPSRQPWMIADRLMGRDIRQAANAGVDYVALVPSGEWALDESRGGNPYPATFVMTAAVYAAVETYGWTLDRGYEELAVESLLWQRPDYPTWRDRWLTTAALWAEGGRHGLTREDVCAMARGFRDTGLHAIPDAFGPGDPEWEEVCDQAGTEDEQCWCLADPCAEAMDCAECNGRSECGWCEGELGCVDRGRAAECEMDGGTWADRITECVDCASRSTCGTCVDRNAFCGWCPGMGCVTDSAAAAAACGADYRRVADGCE